MLKSQSELVGEWFTDGTYEKMYQSYKDYASSGKFNDYRGTILLEDARKNKDVLGFTDEEISDNPIMAQTAMSLLKMAQYAGRGAEDANASGNTGQIRNVQARQGKVAQDINSLSNHRNNRDSFIQSFAGLTSIVDGRSATFGERMSTDKSRHDVNFIDDFQNSLMDASLLSNFIEFFGSDEYNERRNTERELLRTTDINGGMIASITGAVGAFVLESMAMNGLAKLAFGTRVIGAQRMSNVLRFGGQGFALPMLQNINEQAGLTQKYFGDNEIENDWVANVADGIHNVTGMFIGDTYLTPFLGRTFGIGMFKNQKLLQEVVQPLNGITGAANVKTALNGTRLTLDKIPAFKKESGRILKELGKSGKAITDGEISLSLRAGLSISMHKDLVRNTAAFAASDLLADYAFDIGTHNLLDITVGQMTSDGLFSVQQNRMFSISEMKEQGFADALISGVSQRLGMRVGAKMLNGIRTKIGFEEADIDEKTSLFGSMESYDDIMGEGFSKSPINKALVFAKGFIGEDFTKQIDLHLQKTTGTSLIDLAQSTDPNKNIVSLVNAWYSDRYSSTKGLIGLFKLYDDHLDKNPSTRWSDAGVTDFKIGQHVQAKAHVVREMFKEVLRDQQFEVKDLTKSGLEDDLVKYILEGDFTDIDNIKNSFALNSIAIKEEVGNLRDADKLVEKYTNTDGSSKETNDLIDDRIVRKLFNVVGMLSPNSKNQDLFIMNLTKSVAKEITKRVTGIYKTEIESQVAVNEDGTTNKLAEFNESKSFEISTAKAVLELGRGKYKITGKSSGDELNAMRKALKGIVGEDNISKGGMTDEQKGLAIENLRGQLALVEGSLGEYNKDLTVLKGDIQADEVMPIMIDVAQKVLKTDVSDIQGKLNRYDEVRNLVDVSAREVLLSYKTKIENAYSSKTLSDQGKQRRILANVLKAARLMNDVGYRWRPEIKAFSEFISQSKYQNILSEAGKNPKLFETGVLSKFKDSIKDDPDYFNRLITDTMIEMHDVSFAVNRYYSMGNAKHRVEDQIKSIYAGNITKHSSNDRVRASNPLFYWDGDIDKVEITQTGLAKETLVITDDYKVNLRFGELSNHPDDLVNVGYSKQELLELYASALIKRASTDDDLRDMDIKGVTDASAIRNTDGSFTVKFNADEFREKSEDHLQSLMNFTKGVYNNNLDNREMRMSSEEGEQRLIFEINGTDYNHKTFFEQLQYKTAISNFNPMHIALRILQGSKDLSEATGRFVDLLKALDPSYGSGSKDKYGMSNHEKVTLLAKRFISQEAASYAVERKLNIMLRKDGEDMKLVTTDFQVALSPIGNIGDRLNGAIEVINIEFGEDIDFTDAKTLQHLAKANIIPLSKEFGNDLSPIWIRVKEMGGNDKLSPGEITYMKKTMIDSMLDKMASKTPAMKQSIEDLRTGETPKTFEAKILQELTRGGDTTEATFVKKLYASVIEFEKKRITDFAKKHTDSDGVLAWEIKKGKRSAKQLDYPTASMGHINKMLDILKTQSFTMDPKIYKQVESVVNAASKLSISKDITDDQIRKMEDSISEVARIVKLDTEDMIKFTSWQEELRQLDHDWNGKIYDAYDKEDLDSYRMIDGLKGAIDDTEKALSDMDKEVKDTKGAAEHRRLFYTLLAFNEAAVSAKTLQKRVSYMYAQSNILENGKLSKVMDAELDQYLRQMEADKGRIYITNSRADGHNYMSRFLTNIWQNTVGISGGKYTNNTSFGAKFMIQENSELLKTGQKIQIIGEDRPRVIHETDILLDINSLKNMYPELLESLMLHQGKKKGNAIELNLGNTYDANGRLTGTAKVYENGIANPIAKKLLTDISLHTALNASVKKSDPSFQIDNLGNPYDLAMSQSIVKSSIKANRDKLNKMINTESLVADSKSIDGIFRSLTRRNAGIGGTVVASKYNSMKTDGEKRDVELYKDGELFVPLKDKSSVRPGAESLLGSKYLGEIAREYLGYGDLSKLLKKQLRSLAIYLDSVSYHGNDLKNATEVLQKSGVITSFKKQITKEEYDSFVGSKVNTVNHFKRENDGTYTNTLKDEDIFEKASLMALNIVGGKRAPSGTGKNMDVTDGFLTALDVTDKDLLRSNSDNRKTVFALNVSRFPNHNDGQNTMVFIKGITLGGERLAVKDSWYTRVFGGDWDGDTLQIMARSKQDLIDAKVGDDNVFGETSEQIIGSIFDWHYKAMDTYLVEKGGTVLGDKPGGKANNPGDTVAGLRNGRFMHGFMKLDRAMKSTILNGPIATLRKTIKDAPGETFEAEKVSIEYDPNMKGGINDMVIIDRMMANSNNTRNKAVSHGAIKDIQSSDTFELNNKTYKYQVGYIKDKGEYKSVDMLLEIDSKDFGYNIVYASKGKEGVTEANYNENRRAATTHVTTMANKLLRETFELGIKEMDMHAQIATVLKGANTNDTPLTGLIGKRAINPGILNRQAQSVGVNNVKGYGLHYIALQFGMNTNEIVSNLIKTVILSSDLQIADINEHTGLTRLNVMKYKGAAPEVKEGEVNTSYENKLAIQNESFTQQTSKYIESVVKYVNDGAGNTYMKSDEYEEIIKLRKNVTATTTEILKAIAIVEKHEAALFSTDRVSSLIDPDVVIVAEFIKSIRDNYRPFIQKSLDYKADAKLKETLGFDSKLGLFHFQTETEDVETKRVDRINYYDQLLHLDSLETTIESFMAVRGRFGAMALYKKMLKAPAVIGKNMASEESFFNKLMNEVNEGTHTYNPGLSKSVEISSIQEVKNILSDMGVIFKTRTIKTGFGAHVEDFVQSGGEQKYMKKEHDTLKEFDRQTSEAQYSLIFMDKNGEPMRLEDLHGKLTAVTYNKKDPRFNEKMLLISKLISNLSDTSQIAIKLLDSGATTKMADKYLASESEHGTVRHSIQDLKDLQDARAKSINGRYGIFDDAISLRTTSVIETQKLNDC